MQPGGGGRDRAFLPGKNRLIIRAVLLVGRPPPGNIGGQRHVAAFGDCRIKHRAMKSKRQGYVTALAFGLNRRVELAEEADFALLAKPYDVPRVELAGGVAERSPPR